MFCTRYFAERYFPPRFWPKVGDVAVEFTSFAGRGPGVDGNITPLLTDYDEFYLTEGEADERYLQTIPEEYLTQDDGDARYLQSIPAEYITQAEADAQGMPFIEAGGVGDTTSPVREVDSNFTLLAVSSPALYTQSYYNIGATAVIATKPSGYLEIEGSNSISPNTASVFIKRSGVAQFRRWS